MTTKKNGGGGAALQTALEEHCNALILEGCGGTVSGSSGISHIQYWCYHILHSRRVNLAVEVKMGLCTLA